MAATPPPTLVCSRCEAVLHPQTAGSGTGTLACPSCGVELTATVFPALFRPPEKGRAGEHVLVDDEASCFYHPGKKAVTACENCGRFLCGLCEIKLADRLLCSACIESGKQKETIDTLSTRRTLYDDIALAVTVYSFLLGCAASLTAPVAIFLVVRHWKTPQSLIPRSKAKAVAAFTLALLQIAGTAVWIIMMLNS